MNVRGFSVLGCVGLAVVWVWRSCGVHELLVGLQSISADACTLLRDYRGVPNLVACLNFCYSF